MLKKSNESIVKLLFEGILRDNPDIIKALLDGVKINHKRTKPTQLKRIDDSKCKVVLFHNDIDANGYKQYKHEITVKTKQL